MTVAQPPNDHQTVDKVKGDDSLASSAVHPTSGMATINPFAKGLKASEKTIDLDDAMEAIPQAAEEVLQSGQNASEATSSVKTPSASLTSFFPRPNAKTPAKPSSTAKTPAKAPSSSKSKASNSTPAQQQKSLFNFFKPSTTPKVASPVVQTPIKQPSPQTPHPAPIAAPPAPSVTSDAMEVDTVLPEKPSVEEEDLELPKGEPSTQKRKRMTTIDSSDEEMEATPTARKPSVDVVRQPSANRSAISAKMARFAQHADSPRTPSRETAKSATPSSAASLNWTSQGERRKEKMEKFNTNNQRKYYWLDDIMDAEKRRPTDEGYDPRTLWIPRKFWDDATPFEKQYWEIKKDHFDTVVFFKKGKFYELFERDADLGNREFDLKQTDRGYMRMVGVPEASFEYWASKFVAAGYKVAKVEQMETALASQMRRRDSKGPHSAAAAEEESNPTGGIRRELTQILTSGTLMDAALLTNDLSTYIMSVLEVCHEGSANPVEYGVCFADTSTGEFSLVHLLDDADRTQFETLLMQIRPRELVVAQNNLSPATLQIIKQSLAIKPLWNKLTPGVEFWEATFTKERLAIHKYFDTPESEGEAAWPDAVKQMKEVDTVMSALGGMIHYLNVIKLASTLLPMKNFTLYSPMAHASTLVLDGQTLRNLEVFSNSVDGSEEGTLWALVNQCMTPMGKRKLRKWVCHPLSGQDRILERSLTVQFWESTANTLGADLCDLTRDGFKKLPDLERSISRIFNGTAKLKEFLSTLDAFKSLYKLMQQFKEVPVVDLTRTNARLLTQFPFDGIKEHLAYFQTAFDHDLAKEEGVLVPAEGIESDFDEVEAQIVELKKALEKCRKDAQNLIGCAIDFKDLGKELYLMEIPTAKSKKVPMHWKRSRGTKSIDRYYSPETESLVNELKEAQEIRSQILAAIKSRMYVKFSGGYQVWLPAMQTVAELDCLMALAKAGELIGAGGVTCRAEILPDVETHQRGQLVLEAMRHPCATVSSGHDYVPNDTELGIHHSMILLTGPNAGGKSTLLRQTCIAVLLSHLGCRVPAKKMQCTAFDRIFTRIGANDNILAGQSTFMVELAETAKILSTSTPRSLVILDELGRGTSTFDGYAIAFAVMAWLIREGGCIGLFSTHYGMLTDEFSSHPLVKLMHMACHVDDDQREVTFLYKLMAGVCPKSYGMNVARMAGIPEAIVKEAHRAAEHFEAEHTAKRAKKTAQTRAVDAIQREGFVYAWHVLSSLLPTLSAEMRRGLISVMKSWVHFKSSQ